MDTNDLSNLLRAGSAGDQSALNSLTPIVYDELRRLAHYYMERERPGRTLQTSALVNEAYMRLVDYNVKHGRGVPHLTLDEVDVLAADPTGGLTALDEALNALARLDPRKVQIIEMRFFGGLSAEETAEVLKVSPATVRRDWSIAKLWLNREPGGGNDDGLGPLEADR